MLKYSVGYSHSSRCWCWSTKAGISVLCEASYQITK